MDIDESCDAPVVLKSSDGQQFSVPRKVAILSSLVQDMLGDADEDEEASDCPVELPLPNVSSEVLNLVVDYLEHYMKEPMTPITTPLSSNDLTRLVQSWYSEFVKIDRELLFDLVAAANYMDIKPLLDLSCLAVSIMIKGKSAAELRSIFNIQAEMTPEETAQINRENEWVVENNAEPALNNAETLNNEDTLNKSGNNTEGETDEDA